MKNKSTVNRIGWVLLLIGGLNLGFIGLGTLIDSPMNLVSSLVGQWPTLEAIVYLLIGLYALKLLVATVTGKCDGASCD